MNNALEVTVTLTNQKVQFTGVSTSNPERPLIFDYISPIGDGQGFAGLELLLMSFAGCSATTIVYMLRKMGKNISGFKVNAKGIKTEQPPMKFQEIFLKFILHSKDIKDADVQRCIQLAEESFCPVWQMLKNNVKVITDFQINNEND